MTRTPCHAVQAAEEVSVSHFVEGTVCAEQKDEEDAARSHS